MRLISIRTVSAALLAAFAASQCNVHAQYQNRVGQAQRSAGVTSVRQGAAISGARPVTAQASVIGMQKALTAFAMDVGRLPTGAEGLNALIYPPPGVRNWRGPYVSTNNWRAAFTDPWGNLYRYVVQGTGRQAIHYIISNGPDRLPNTRDDLSVQF